ncbi:MAG TPA: transcription antitermination factor NusB [Petrotogaceae bacterium]|nr:transcription antitermination factor NusB [Petrotogaceae bacterium]
MERELAYKLLRQYEKKETISNESVKQARNMLDERSFGLFKSLVWGSIRNIAKEDWLISKFVDKSKDLTPASLWLLRLGFYQLISGFDEHAAVYETVALVSSKKSKSFINAVLRNYIRAKDTLGNEPENVKYLLPKWLYEYIRKRHTFSSSIIKFNTSTPRRSIRVNSLKTSREELLQMLADSKIAAQTAKYSPYGIYIDEDSLALEETELYRKGYFYIQNESSQLIPILLNPQIGEQLLDLCSAPGGKCTFSAELMKNTGSIKAVDNDISRLESVSANCKRHGITNVSVQLNDASEFRDAFEYDKLMLDVPCTSLGTAYAHPEVLFRVKKEDFERYAQIQRKILTNAMSNIKVKGEIAYSTCTLSWEENTGNMKWLKKNFNVSFLDLRERLGSLGVKFHFDGYGAYIFQDEGLIPFYIAMFRKETLKTEEKND